MNSSLIVHCYGPAAKLNGELASAPNLVRSALGRWNTSDPDRGSQLDVVLWNNEVVLHDIQGAKEFKSTDFTALLFPTTVKYEETRSAAHQKKISRKLDIVSIIPIPHFVECPDASRKPSSGIFELRPHRISEILNPNVHTILLERHRYCQWLIPVSGTPPGSTKLSSATFLLHPSDGTVQAVTQSNHSSRHQIHWSHTDLLLFWLWLRDVQTKSIFGPISLSITSAALRSPRSYANESSRPRRNSFHHISIYHDANFSLRLRAFIAPFDPSRISDKLLPESRSILVENYPERAANIPSSRPLKGAVLLLLDDANKGLLVS